jgi:hypothetical protein
LHSVASPSLEFLNEGVQHSFECIFVSGANAIRESLHGARKRRYVLTQALIEGVIERCTKIDRQIR